MLNKSRIITTIILIVEEFCRRICLELEIEFSSGACGRASFQKQRCPPWLASRWGINACERPGCLSQEQNIVKEKEHKEPETRHPCPQTPPQEPHLWGSLVVWQGGVLWWVQIVTSLVAAVTSKGIDSLVGIWQHFCN